MAKKADIEHRDDLFYLKLEYGIDPPAPEEVLEARRESHCQTDGGKTIPLCTKISNFARHTLRRSPCHSHPNNDHSLHPLESNSTGMDTVKKLKRKAESFRDLKKSKWEVQND